MSKPWIALRVPVGGMEIFLSPGCVLTGTALAFGGILASTWFAVAFGSGTPDMTIAMALVWIVLGPLYLLVHELGHGVAFRLAGVRPTVVVAIASHCDWTEEVPLTVPQRVLGSAGGVVATVAVGGLAVVALGVFGADDGVLFAARQAFWWLFIGVGLLNLLPFLPTDGGSIVDALVPGSPDSSIRDMRVGLVSLAFAIVCSALPLLILVPLCARPGACGENWHYGMYAVILTAPGIYFSLKHVFQHRTDARSEAHGARIMKLALAGSFDDALALADRLLATAPDASHRVFYLELRAVARLFQWSHTWAEAAADLDETTEEAGASYRPVLEDLDRIAHEVQAELDELPPDGDSAPLEPGARPAESPARSDPDGAALLRLLDDSRYRPSAAVLHTLAIGLYIQKNHAAAARVMIRQHEADPQPGTAFNIGACYLWVRDDEQALAWFRRAADGGFRADQSDSLHRAASPALRDDPRFVALVRELCPPATPPSGTP